jgi:hypothetical protein
MRVEDVFPQSGADVAGLFEGDVIASVDGVSLAGLSVNQGRAHLRGAAGSTARLVVVRFPGGGSPENLDVLRGTRTDAGKEPPGPPPSMSEREANILLGCLRTGRPANPGPSIRTWTEADPAEADPALLLLLRQADGLGLTMEPKQRVAFWTGLAADAGFQGLLASRAPAVRLEAARSLAAHAASAPLALQTLKALPIGSDGALRDEALRLARAVATGKPSAVAALDIPETDLAGPEGFRASYGPRLSDRVALELAQEVSGAQPTDATDPPASLPPEVARRLERTSLAVPWKARVEAPEFGFALAPLAPQLRAETLGGGDLDVAKHKGPLVVAFWASWCGPCMQELPRLQALTAPLSPTGLELWAISIDDDVSRVPQAIERIGLHVPVGHIDDATQARWGVSSIPRMFVLDAEHRVVIDHTGYADESFDKVGGEIEAVARGERKATRALGNVLFGEGAFSLLGSGPAEPRPLALATDVAGRVWASLDNQDALAPLYLAGQDLSFDLSLRVPLPFEADRVIWADLDGDGTEELITARTGHATVRVGRPSGTTLWTSRSADPVADIGVAAGPDGRPRLVVLRSQSERKPGPPGGPAEISQTRSRLEFFDAAGHPAGRAILPDRIVDMAADPGSDKILAVFPSGDAVAVSADGSLSPVTRGADPVRGVAFADVDGDGKPETLLGSNTAKNAWAGTFGAKKDRRVVILTSGGDLVGTGADGTVRFRLDLQRPPIVTPGDIDQDGRVEIVLWAPWFGLAALRVE